MTPQQASVRKVELAVLYARLSQQLEEILAVKPKEWLLLRSSAKSSREADRAWEASDMGIKEMRLKMEMGRNEKEVSSLNSFLRVVEMEARNQI